VIQRRPLLFAGLALTTFLVVCGGCGGGQEPDKPATLTPEVEKEILEKANAASQSEAGQPK